MLYRNLATKVVVTTAIVSLNVEVNALLNPQLAGITKGAAGAKKWEDLHEKSGVQTDNMPSTESGGVEDTDYIKKMREKYGSNGHKKDEESDSDSDSMGGMGDMGGGIGDMFKGMFGGGKDGKGGLGGIGDLLGGDGPNNMMKKMTDMMGPQAPKKSEEHTELEEKGVHHDHVDEKHEHWEEKKKWMDHEEKHRKKVNIHKRKKAKHDETFGNIVGVMKEHLEESGLGTKNDEGEEEGDEEEEESGIDTPAVPGDNVTKDFPKKKSKSKKSDPFNWGEEVSKMQEKLGDHLHDLQDVNHDEEEEDELVHETIDKEHLEGKFDLNGALIYEPPTVNETCPHTGEKKERKLTEEEHIKVKKTGLKQQKKKQREAKKQASKDRMQKMTEAVKNGDIGEMLGKLGGGDGIGEMMKKMGGGGGMDEMMKNFGGGEGIGEMLKKMSGGGMGGDRKDL